MPKPAVPDVERRVIPTGALELREEGGVQKIVGYAAVFDTLSSELWGFRERILPGAFDRTLEDKADVRALVNHDSGRVIGRTKSGTLTLITDKRGLLAKITPPDTSAARDAIESIRRGDLDGMSFAFRTRSDEWHMEDGETIRELIDVDLHDGDVSVVAYPAYPDTDVAVRSLEEFRKSRENPARETDSRRRRQQLAEVEG